MGRSWRAGTRALIVRARFWWGRVVFSAPDADPATARGPLWSPLLLLALLAGALLFPNLSYPLLEPDEGRYAEIGREMLARGDWVVPTLNHEPYYDKPPLVYWLVAVSLHFLGTHVAAARSVPALAAFLTVLATFLFTRRHFGSRVGWLSGLALALMPAFTQCGRTLILDSVLALFVVLSLFTAYEAIRGRRLHWGWWTASAACCTLAVLTKGPVALVLLGPPLVACAWLRRDGPRPGLVAWAVYVGLVVCLAAPWFVVFSARDGAFPYEFFVRHHLLRYLGEDFHAGPIWYYLPVLLAGCLPWSFLFPSLTWFLCARRPPAGVVRPRALGFCLLWVGWCLLFFSLSRGKLPPYILPALPALAILLGSHLDAVLWGPLGRSSRWAALWAPHLATGGLAITWLGVIGWFWARGLASPGAQPRLLAEAILCLLVLVGGFWWGCRNLRTTSSPRAAWAVCAAFGCALLLEVSNGFLPAWAAHYSPLPWPAEIRRWLSDGETAVVAWGDEWGSVAFRLERDPLFLSAARSSPAALRQFLSEHRRSLVIIKDEELAARLLLVVPPGMAVQQVAQHPRTRLFLVEPQRHVEDRGSRIEDRGLRIEDRGSKAEFPELPRSILDPLSSILDVPLGFRS
ncbi:MAG TPA: glycosyltransferase family 39 protein, partial [Gemmataceae bacterium]|nr:glycosyltransferase family 39 protein [Gemmataceae bacterium]